MSTATLQDPAKLVTDAIGKVSAIATLPEVTAQIIKTVEDPRSSAAQLHKIISHDPALVTRILKVVNSSFYGLPGQIASIERAIVLLGLNAVKNIAVAASLGQLFRSVKLCEGYTAKDLWTHCIAVGVTARELARQTKMPIADEAFLAGMIHDLGILVALQSTPEQMGNICATAMSSGGNFCEIERQSLGFDHQQLGAALAAHWKFPRSCQLVAGHHHDPGSLGEDVRTLVTLVYVADTICCQEKRGFPLTAAGQSLDSVNVEALGLNNSIIERVKQSLPELIESASASLG